MSRFAAVRYVRPVPMFTAAGSVLLILGTWVGQSGHAKGEAYAGSQVQPASGSNTAGMANMPGMVMPANSGGDAKPAPDTASTPAALAGMAMSPADPMAGMNMATANMAAMMPGGYHLDCTAKACTLIISDSATATIPVLGLHVKLAKLHTGTVSLQVNGKTVTIQQAKQAKIAGVAIRAEKTSTHESTLRFSKAK